MEAEEENREPDIGEDTKANGEEDTQTEAEAGMERDEMVVWPPETVIELRSVLFIF